MLLTNRSSGIKARVLKKRLEGYARTYLVSVIEKCTQDTNKITLNLRLHEGGEYEGRWTRGHTISYDSKQIPALLESFGVSSPEDLEGEVGIATRHAQRGLISLVLGKHTNQYLK